MTTDPSRWARTQALFLDALDQPEHERTAWLARQTVGDGELLAEVQSLLRADAGPTALDRRLGVVAEELLADAGHALPPGTRFGPYELESLVGEGGMGVVYRARRPDLGQPAAIKILRDAWLSPARRDRFEAEQRALAELSHPGIARLFDAGVQPDGTPWFAMEYVEGQPLTTWARTHTTTIRERLRLFRRVCEAVLDAHRHAIIHRDLKPSNILVTADGGIKLLDFGIAKHLEDAGGQDQTRTGFRLMTPAYAAPEQLLGGRIGVTTDVHALGVILYELLTGRLPRDLEGQSVAEAVRIVAEHEPVRPSALWRTLGARGEPRPAQGSLSWADLDVLCLSAMHRDQARRYASVEALIRDVDHTLDGEPLEARPDSVAYRTGKFLRRHRVTATAAVVALAAVIALTVVYTVRLARARDAAVSAAARTQRIQQFTLGLFSGGDDAAAPAESLRVISLVDLGVEQARALDGEPALQAELMQTLGGLYQQLGNLARADSLLTLSLERRTELLGSRHPDVARGQVALALLRVEQARLDEADSLARAGLALTRASALPGDPAIAAATAALGQVLQEKGSYEESANMLAEAVRLDSLAGDSVRLAADLSALASTHFYAGEYAQSDSINARVLALSRALHGERHPAVAEDLINLGATRFERGEYAEAERYYREALGITEGWYGPDHPRTAAQRTMVARSLVYQEKFAEALPLLEQSLATRERVYGPAHPAVASTQNDIGNASLRLGDLDRAEAAFRGMIGTYHAAYGERHWLIGTAESNLATVMTERGRLAEAERLYRGALVQFESTQGPEHVNTGIAHVKLGRALLKQQRYAEAAAESRRGYDILVPQMAPNTSFLRAARTDMAAAYEALGRTGEATAMREEQRRAEGG